MSARLLAFDFDDTLVTNSPQLEFRRWCGDLASDGDEVPDPRGIRNIVPFQNDVFAFLHGKGKSIDDILRRAEMSKRLTAGMQNLLTAAREELACSVLIVSDNNSVVVEHMLNFLGIRHLIDDVITNPAKICCEGRLRVSPWHTDVKDDDCTYSFVNLCKGRAIEEYMHDKGLPGPVAYVGDNTNDLCPALRLSSADYLFARSGFPLQGLTLDTEHSANIKASVSYWTTADSILEELNKAWRLQ